jgi:short-subunit dehydrogenase
MRKKVLVVGASSGIGSELVKELLLSGATVSLVARREENMREIVKSVDPEFKRSHIYVHNVTDYAKVNEIFREILRKMDGLDEIYFAAGVIEKIGPEEFNTEKDIKTLSINLLGAFAWLNPAAEFFQRQGRGKIIGISSVAGERGRVGNPSYYTSKAGFNVYLESLRNRLSKKGVQVLTVKPGFIDTAMTKGIKGLFWLISANKAAKIIIKASEKGKENIFVPARWRLIAFVIRNIPSFIFKKLKI